MVEDNYHKTEQTYNDDSLTSHKEEKKTVTKFSQSYEIAQFMMMLTVAVIGITIVSIVGVGAIKLIVNTINNVEVTQ